MGIREQPVVVLLCISVIWIGIDQLVEIAFTPLISEHGPIFHILRKVVGVFVEIENGRRLDGAGLAGAPLDVAVEHHQHGAIRAINQRARFCHIGDGFFRIASVMDENPMRRPTGIAIPHIDGKPSRRVAEAAFPDHRGRNIAANFIEAALQLAQTGRREIDGERQDDDGG